MITDLEGQVTLFFIIDLQDQCTLMSDKTSETNSGLKTRRSGSKTCTVWRNISTFSQNIKSKF